MHAHSDDEEATGVNFFVVIAVAAPRMKTFYLPKKKENRRTVEIKFRVMLSPIE